MRSMRPCQNSTTSGRMRQPPQCGGTGTSSASAKRRWTFASAFSSTVRSRTTADCGEAHAPSCEPRGRDDQYVLVSAGLTFSTVPRTVAWRCSVYQGKVAEAKRVDIRSWLLAEV